MKSKSKELVITVKDSCDDCRHPENLDKLPEWLEVEISLSRNECYDYISAIKIVGKPLTFETVNLLEAMATEVEVSPRNSKRGALMCNTLRYVYEKAAEALLDALEDASFKVSSGKWSLYGFPGTIISYSGGKKQIYSTDKKEISEQLARESEEFLESLLG